MSKPLITGELSEQLHGAALKMQDVEKIATQFVMGQDKVIKVSLASTLASGHILYNSDPGLAKTRLVRVFGRAMGLDTSRIQFVPDLMPADILGMEMLKEDATGEQRLQFIEGPIFAQMVHADEGNRASSRTQAALLQAMEEKLVTVAGVTYRLPEPFIVSMTQNPSDDNPETQPLPPAQMDRFTVCLELEDLTDLEMRKKILRMTTQGDQNASIQSIEPVFERVEQKLIRLDEPNTVPEHGLRSVQKLVERIPMPEEVEDYVIELTHKVRPRLKAGKENPDAPDYIRDNFEKGASGERAAKALGKLARAWTLLEAERSENNLVVTKEDVRAIAAPALAHRLEPKGLSAVGLGVATEAIDKLALEIM